MRPTYAEAMQFVRGERDEMLAVIAMAKRTGLPVFEVRLALREVAETMRKLKAEHDASDGFRCAATDCSVLVKDEGDLCPECAVCRAEMMFGE